MGLLFSGGSTKSVTETDNFYTSHAEDNKIAGDNGSFVTRGENVTINQTSDEAVDLARLSLDGFDTASEGAFRVADDAFQFSDAALGSALRFANDNNDASNRLSGRALDAADDAARQAAINQREGYYFAKDINRDSLSAAQDAQRDGFGFGRDALDFADRRTSAALGFVEAGNDDAFGFANRSLDQIDRSQAAAFDFAKGGLGQVSNALATTLNASSEDSTQLSQQLIRLGIPALALVAIVWGFRK